MKLIIDRSKWLRGKEGDGQLLAPDGQMCCLGFLGKECGFDDKELFCEGTPREVRSRAWPSWLVDVTADPDDEEDDEHVDTAACDALIRANDSGKLTEQARERKLSELFAEHGVEVEFIDGEKP